jgi:hypothetical protein
MNNLPGATMTLRDEFESWISLPPFEHMCDRNSNKSAWPGAYKRYETELAWEAYQAAAALQADRIAALEAQRTAHEGEAPALDIEEFIAAKKYYTTIANPEEMDGTESVSVAELREFMHSQVATASPQAAYPIAAVTGYHSGHCVVEPIDRARLLPVGMALYSGAQKGMGTNGHCDYPDCRCPIDKTDSCLKGLPNA